TPLPRPRPKWALLVFPSYGLSTADVYRRFDSPEVQQPGQDEAVQAKIDFAEWAQLPAEELSAMLMNDLEDPAFAIRPDLGALRAALKGGLSRPVRMSGSGSTLSALVATADEAASAQAFCGGLDCRSHVVTLCPDESDIFPG